MHSGLPWRQGTDKLCCLGHVFQAVQRRTSSRYSGNHPVTRKHCLCSRPAQVCCANKRPSPAKQDLPGGRGPRIASPQAWPSGRQAAARDRTRSRGRPQRRIRVQLLEACRMQPADSVRSGGRVTPPRAGAITPARSSPSPHLAAHPHPRTCPKASSPVERRKRPGTARNVPTAWQGTAAADMHPRAQPGGPRPAPTRGRLFNSPLPRCRRPTRARGPGPAGQWRRAAVREPANGAEAAR